MSDFIPIRDRISVTVPVASQATGISRPVLYRMMKDGRLRWSDLTGRRLISVKSLLPFLPVDEDNPRTEPERESA